MDRKFVLSGPVAVGVPNVVVAVAPGGVIFVMKTDELETPSGTVVTDGANALPTGVGVVVAAVPVVLVVVPVEPPVVLVVVLGVPEVVLGVVVLGVAAVCARLAPEAVESAMAATEARVISDKSLFSCMVNSISDSGPRPKNASLLSLIQIVIKERSDIYVHNQGLGEIDPYRRK